MLRSMMTTSNRSFSRTSSACSPSSTTRTLCPARSSIPTMTRWFNAVNQRVIVGILERAGHRVRVVDDGEQALDVLENERFDVVIMDLNMPELGGLDAARAYRVMDPEGTPG